MGRDNTRTFKQGTSSAQSPRNFDKRFNGTIPEASVLILISVYSSLIDWKHLYRNE